MKTQGRLAVRWLTIGVVVAGATGLLGVLALWPRGDAPDLGVQPQTYVDATVTGVDTDTCEDPEGVDESCDTSAARAALQAA